ncbi:hypothetical protein NVP1261O_62 [Vibrio phage 1.261.O._10N.286.51.A7]|uniref:Uncharacterized protein n=3 Tax=Mukerjeevirus TaxID=2733146 RepID=A0A2I7REK7_9CAUD|nr:hypothetical protein HOU76_gp45 [Vibrio phage 1.169.O._10N.261.52.B1]YP_009817665.1 hypothetical protein HOU79_gp41 [Vibrio phage 1.224.A._10N.261.48.B1]YP_009817747.1 hypothetical protein HOU80_gp40 [Vibrio phage 1.261.O._10N.286.51.A7]AUR92082.1 hypothetical protein NVP1169O_54 [Vibrio phage 1.169.O._10N.261.52.B1]AUR96432.1 hypothetical protein NVP1224A_65 [Vibrio phage 1.224.A._10N.261.48.B1]AUR99066.1 hypothetical protein NVP1261O_62 [Vibrio phage 1.261.O._10N.286.51.A7]
MKQILSQLKTRKRTGKGTIGNQYLATLAVKSGMQFQSLREMLLEAEAIKRAPNSNDTYLIV